MNHYKTFRFVSYEFDAGTKQLSLQYGYDDELLFTETFSFNFDFIAYDETALDRACQLVFFVAGVSYYKMYLAPSIRIDAGNIDEITAEFLSETYVKGLGEFFYVNKLSPDAKITFPVNTHETLNMLSVSGKGSLVGIGGGKDSLVSVEMLRDQAELNTWSVGHKQQLEPLIHEIGLPHLWVERQWDRQLLTLNEQGAYNGHIPISAILASVGTVCAILSGKRDVVVSNEWSANEATLNYRDVEINHQYSKSSAFEHSYQSLLRHHFGDSIRYYSLLRPLSELRIAELFSTQTFEKYKTVFSSCNRTFTDDSNKMTWCGTCSKCAFVYLILSMHISDNVLVTLFGKNLLLNEELVPTYEQLLGISGEKPLECVGEIRESRYAMTKAIEKYPELGKTYTFELDDSYDYHEQHPQSMPKDVLELVNRKF